MNNALIVMLTNDNSKGLSLQIYSSGMLDFKIFENPLLPDGILREKDPFSLKEEKGSPLLPDGFVERVGDMGLILEWAPQTKILGHSSTGGFLSHCGWSSLTESMKFGVPIIGMPMKVDQPTNAKLAVEIGIGINVRRDSEGKYKRDEISDAIRKVLVDESGEAVRTKARELSSTMKEKGEEDLDIAAEKLVHICRKKKET